MEPWDEQDGPEYKEEEAHIQTMLEKYHKEEADAAKENEEAGGGESSMVDAEQEGDTPTDEVMFAFQRRMASAPAQVVRYYGASHAGGAGSKPVEPTWVGSRGRMAGKPPPCKCGSPRRLDFQITPQVLNLVEPARARTGAAPPTAAVSKEEDKARMRLQMDFDFGTISLYSCSAACSLSPAGGGGCGYAEEFTWRQPGPDSHLTGNMEELIKSCRPPSRKC
ncbi:programmed cell death protein 2 [Baffinella frigidus]|nr:programmed cell death protein 2 [Cryptophyta sp. CCMP2293]